MLKRFFTVVAVLGAAMTFASCEKDNGNGGGNASPIVMTWEGHDDLDAPVELASEMDVVINISSPAGFSSFVVDIKSPVLEALKVTSIDFIDTSSNSPMVGMVLPEILGDQDIATATELSLDLSKLVPLIITVGGLNGTLTPGSNHIFTLNITDKEGNGFSQALTFHYTGENTAE